MMPAKMRDDVWKRKVAMDRQNGSSLASICVLERYKTWVRVMGKIGGSPGVVGCMGVITRRGGAVIVAGCGCGDRSSKPDGCFFFSKLHIFLSFIFPDIIFPPDKGKSSGKMFFRWKNDY